jgi:hypothetical protein
LSGLTLQTYLLSLVMAMGLEWLGRDGRGVTDATNSDQPHRVDPANALVATHNASRSPLRLRFQIFMELPSVLLRVRRGITLAVDFWDREWTHDARSSAGILALRPSCIGVDAVTNSLAFR